MISTSTTAYPLQQAIDNLYEKQPQIFASPIPMDLIFHIFSYLEIDAEKQLQMHLVSHTWQEIYDLSFAKSIFVIEKA